jgi:hypothetical protein
MTVTELAYLSGRSAWALARYEDGTHAPSTAVLGKLAAILGVEVQALFAPEAEVTVAPRHRRSHKTT